MPTNRLSPWIAALFLLAGGTARAEMAPFVGCASDGQMGPGDAPQGKPVDVAGGRELAYYSDGRTGVLAPKGWSCFGTYGSNGSSLFVTPKPLDRTGLFSDRWHGIADDGIQVSVNIGDTSGRFSAARIAARVFPSKKDYVQHVVDEGFMPASEFVFGPYPTDRLTYKNDLVVEYETPANTQGLGTQSRLVANKQPIRGVAIFTNDDDTVLHLSARLPQKMQHLLPTILQAFESEHRP